MQASGYQSYDRDQICSLVLNKIFTFNNSTTCLLFCHISFKYITSSYPKSLLHSPHPSFMLGIPHTQKAFYIAKQLSYIWECEARCYQLKLVFHFKIAKNKHALSYSVMNNRQKRFVKCHPYQKHTRFFYGGYPIQKGWGDDKESKSRTCWILVAVSLNQ